MELCCSSTQNSQFLSRNSIFSPKFCLSSSIKRNSHRYNIPTSNSSLYLPFSTFNTKKFQILARFRQSSNRRNSLRRKLIEDQQVSKNLNLLNPNRDFDDNSSFLHDLDSDSVTKSDSDLGIREVIPESNNVENLNNPILMNKLEKWADQYKKDIDLWGIGSGPIFTIFQDLNGNVINVIVNEDEILKRNGELEDSNVKLSYAKNLAKEMKNGNNVIPKNSSVAKFIVNGKPNSFVSIIRGMNVRPNLNSKFSRIGVAVLCGFFVLWAVKSLFSMGKNDVEITRLEKEMLRRKMKSRTERNEMEKGKVEIIQYDKQEIVSTKRPTLDKQEIVNTILNLNRSNDKLALSEDVDEKIQEIREMARKARENEGKSSLLDDESDEEEDLIVNEERGEDDVESSSNSLNIDSRKILGINGSVEFESLDIPKRSDTMFLGKANSSMVYTNEKQEEEEDIYVDEEKLKQSSYDIDQDSRQVSGINDSIGDESLDTKNSWDKEVPKISSMKTLEKLPTDLTLLKNDEITLDFLDNREMTEKPSSPKGQSSAPKTKSRVIRSVKEAREYLSKKRDKGDHKHEGESITGPENLTNFTNHDIETKANGNDDEISEEKWLEKNFHELEPVINKIRLGFSENFTVAKEKHNEDLNINQLGTDEDDYEFAWMRDDHLREIVFKVRENELTGRDPFHMLSAEDKAAFFEGLEKKVEEENKELLKVHEYLHSNIENLDYGADGISIYDPPEKIIPRWKGPPLEKNPDPEYLNNFLEQRKTILDQMTKIPHPINDNPQNSSIVYEKENKLTNGSSRKSKTVIEGSDGSVKTGKKTGKEFWKHTKKWSRGFLESYNAESDPEVKSIMKDVGKDLDRWISEKEIEEAGNLLQKLPDKNREFIEKKLEKLKREMELYGPQAVVSKYSEYADKKEEDYLWWLDLPYVLCIELYTNDNGEQRIGFYSLEMAEDLELEPKQFHVIAFEDASDCKNLCYIINSHMEMLGNGNAFVVARPPKDAFREAKANGFSVTVIRKGELQLNIDQPLEEVEESISEIGSKIYHDKITRERSVDTSSLMKGVFGFGKPSTLKRKSKKRKLLKKRRK